MPDLTLLRAFWWGVLHAIGMFGMFGMDNLTSEEKIVTADQQAWFCCGEVVMAGIIAGVIAVPAGLWFATQADQPLAFIGAAVLFLPLFVFLGWSGTPRRSTPTPSLMHSGRTSRSGKSSGPSSSPPPASCWYRSSTRQRLKRL